MFSAPIGQCPERIWDARGELVERKVVPVSTAASGDTLLVSSVPGRRIKVLRCTLVASGSVTVQLLSGSDGMRLTGAMSMVAGRPLHTPSGVRTNPGEALYLNLGGAVQVSGWLEYCEISDGWESDFLGTRYGSVILGFDANVAASRNNSTEAVGDVVTAITPIDGRHTEDAAYKWTQSEVDWVSLWESTNYGIAATNYYTLYTARAPFHGEPANNMGNLFRNRSAVTIVMALRSKNTVSANRAILQAPVGTSNVTRLGLQGGYLRTWTLSSRAADTDTITQTTSVDSWSDQLPRVFVITLNYGTNKGNFWSNGTQIVTDATLSSSAASTTSNTASSEAIGLLGSSPTQANFSGFPAELYLMHIIDRAVSPTEVESITNHVRYLRGF